MDKIVSLVFESDFGKDVYGRIIATCEKYKMLDALNDGVLIGFSGGADSVMLLLFVCEYKRRNGLSTPIVAVHINHCIRGDEANRDELFSREFCKTLGVEFISARIDIPSLAEKAKLGLEEMARKERYNEFERIICSRKDISKILVAHNATDNVETVIFNILRGSGLKGASGIPVLRENIIRPLIEISKRDIFDLLDEHDIPYVTDTTNGNLEFSRNYIRHVILPHFNKINPKYESAISSLSELLSLDADYFEFEAKRVIRENYVEYISRDVLLGLHRSVLSRVLIVLFRDISSYMLAKRQIDSIIELLLKGDNFKVSLYAGVSFICERGHCYFSKYEDIDLSEYKQMLVDGENKLRGFSAVIHLGNNFDNSSSNVYKFSIQQDLSSAIIVGSLYVRFKEDGDAYFYGGMKHKLKKVFNDRNIPPSERSLIPVICDDKGIVWVPGLSVRDDGVPKEKRKKYMISLSLFDDETDKKVYIANIREK